MNWTRDGAIPYVMWCVGAVVVGMVVVGCAGLPPEPGLVKISNDGILSRGFYRLEAPDEHWLRMINLRPSLPPLVGYPVTDDAFYFRCPEQQVIQIARTRNVKPGESFPLVGQEGIQQVFDNFIRNAGLKIEEMLSTQPKVMNNSQAAEFNYLVSGVPNICSHAAGVESKMKARAVVIQARKRSFPALGGEHDFVLLVYTSSAARFDQSLDAFDRMVQSFTFLN
jgi:hypothetical protein